MASVRKAGRGEVMRSFKWQTEKFVFDLRGKRETQESARVGWGAVREGMIWSDLHFRKINLIAE